MMTTTLYYFAMKTFLLYSIVRSLSKYEPLQKHVLFLAMLYTACVALLSYVFLVAPKNAPDIKSWQYWLGITFLLSTLYFWLLTRFDEGVVFWALVLMGLGLVYY